MCRARGSGVCSVLSPEELSALYQVSERISFPPGHIFIEEGTDAWCFYNVTQGTVKLFRSLPDGRRQITGFGSPGCFIGLAVTETYGFGAETVEAVTLCRFSRKKLETLVNRFPQLERRLLNEASHELVLAQDQMLLLGRKTARERVASFLLTRIAADDCEHTQDSIVLHLPMTRADIADYLGLTIETVSRTLSRMRQDGLIRTGADRMIEIRSRERLRTLSLEG
ncbi:helix-turn-helix domain-containing protein [Acetobacter sp. AN02]|nr:helix-turn-helix domain-containing protein [Acetobacter sp. AN02]MDG6093867.1 helix-turn-helix domain-containing protein [Acetobacter sp. AN02]